jgi:hypothetical protein
MTFHVIALVKSAMLHYINVCMHNVDWQVIAKTRHHIRCPGAGRSSLYGYFRSRYWWKGWPIPMSRRWKPGLYWLLTDNSIYLNWQLVVTGFPHWQLLWNYFNVWFTIETFFHQPHIGSEVVVEAVYKHALHVGTLQVESRQFGHCPPPSCTRSPVCYKEEPETHS